MINMSKTLLTGLFVFVLAGATLACVPEVPANPTYTNDVAAIFDAHCARCHGANDMLATMPVGVTQTAMKPNICYLNRYDDAGSCCLKLVPGSVDRGRQISLFVVIAFKQAGDFRRIGEQLTFEPLLLDDLVETIRANP